MQLEINSGSASRSLNLLNLYTRQRRPSYVTINGPKSYILPVMEDPEGNLILFNGNHWVTYDMSKLEEGYRSDTNTREILTLTFRTLDRNSPLWFSSDEDRDILVTLMVRIVIYTLYIRGIVMTASLILFGSIIMNYYRTEETFTIFREFRENLQCFQHLFQLSSS